MKALIAGLVALPIFLSANPAYGWDLKDFFRGKDVKTTMGTNRFPKDKVGTLAGGISSGGGTVVEKRPGEQPELVDFLLVNDQFQSRFVPNLLGSMIPRNLGPYVEKLGYDHITPEALKASDEFQLATQRIKTWSQNSPVVTRMLLEEMGSLRFSYTNRDLNFNCIDQRPIVLMNQLPSAQLNVASIYHGYYGAVINVPVYARMGVESRAGILVHETFRKLQVTYKQEISNETIWQMTAALILGSPTGAKGRLDEHPGLGRYVELERYIHYGDILVAEVCAEAAKKPHLKKTNAYCNGTEQGFKAPPEQFPRYFDPYKHTKDTRTAEEKARDAEKRRIDDRLHDIYARAQSDWHEYLDFRRPDTTEEENLRESAYKFVQYVNHVQLKRAVDSFSARTRLFQQAFVQLAQVFAPLSSTGETYARDRINGTLKAEKWSDQRKLERLADHLICALDNGFDAAMKLSYCPAGSVPTFQQFDAEITRHCQAEFPIDKDGGKSSRSQSRWEREDEERWQRGGDR